MGRDFTLFALIDGHRALRQSRAAAQTVSIDSPRPRPAPAAAAPTAPPPASASAPGRAPAALVRLHRPGPHPGPRGRRRQRRRRLSPREVRPQGRTLGRRRRRRRQRRPGGRRGPVAPCSTSATAANTRRPPGEDGANKDMYGRGGEDLVLRVPPGTQVFDDAAGRLLGRSAARTASGSWPPGAGGAGAGNIHFATSTDRAPRRAEPGHAGRRADAPPRAQAAGRRRPARLPQRRQVVADRPHLGGAPQDRRLPVHHPGAQPGRGGPVGRALVRGGRRPRPDRRGPRRHRPRAIASCATSSAPACWSTCSRSAPIPSAPRPRTTRRSARSSPSTTPSWPPARRSWCSTRSTCPTPASELPELRQAFAKRRNLPLPGRKRRHGRGDAGPAGGHLEGDPQARPRRSRAAEAAGAAPPIAGSKPQAQRRRSPARAPGAELAPPDRAAGAASIRPDGLATASAEPLGPRRARRGPLSHAGPGSPHALDAGRRLGLPRAI